MALANGSATAEEGNNEHDGADDNEDPWCYSQVGLELILDDGPVEQERHTNADHRQAKELGREDS